MRFVCCRFGRVTAVVLLVAAALPVMVLTAPVAGATSYDSVVAADSPLHYW